MKEIKNSDNLFNTEVITNFLKEKGLSKTKFCKLCRISLKEYNKFMNDDSNVGLLTVYKMAKFIKVQLKDLFVPGR